MKLKLFCVDIESYILVLAENKEQAEKYADSCHISDSDKLERASYWSREIKRLRDVDGDWLDSFPYIDGDSDWIAVDEGIDNLTCKEIMEIVEFEIEKARLKVEADKLQMKFDFDTPKPVEKAPEKPAEKDSDVLCKSCGYKGPIYTFEPTMSAYSDIRCPKCKSTNCDHNADYLTTLSNAMKEIGEKAKQLPRQ